jgi:hypothetical protein
MLKLLRINIYELKQYINIAFNDDYDFINYYDKNTKIKTIEELVEKTNEKILDYPSYFGTHYSYRVDFDNKSIGYLFITKKPNLLVSFSINKKYRNKEILKNYFDIIKKELGNSFCCLLYKENIRAINWLKKCGMKPEDGNDVYVKLNL